MAPSRQDERHARSRPRHRQLWSVPESSGHLLTPSPFDPIEDRLESRFADSGGARIHFKIGGDGSPVLLLHGLPDFWLGWRAQIAALAPRHTVLAPDLRGLNLSSRPQGLDHYAMAALIGDALAVLDATGVARASIVGHDWGGMIAWWLATYYPERVDRLVVIAAPHPLDYLAAVRAQPEALDYLRNITGSTDWNTGAAAITWWAEPGYRARLLDVLAEAGQNTIASFYRANVQRSVGAPFDPPKVAAPTLSIRGEDDPVVPAGAYDALASRVAGPLATRLLKGCGHYPQHTDADAVSALLVAFLR